MAKTYAESVKLPNLVAVPHPATKMSSNGLNIEGVNTRTQYNSGGGNLITQSLDRKSFIVNLLETDQFKTKKKKSVCTSTDEVIGLA